MDLKALIRDVPDFPKPGILFRDLTTLLQDQAGLRYVIDQLADRYQGQKIDYIAGIESRGFIFGAPLAYRLGVGFIPLRKPGKLCSPVYAVEYSLEYGSDRLEMHQDAVQPDRKVLVVDDLIATGGTAAAAAQLIQQSEGELTGFAFIVELMELNGRNLLPDVPITTLVNY
ncbi:adenine phosphoribosyltransferase [Candidatus Synechococcus calcipolaris G9]|uniref:Adenine phosphoribosyltransferase n=1 Tax=Candidatus Synechococcus calcipolaris G9 TaxID=1497997 RepID=A0ABT6F026_9SYNE|nr:adenine phosphoribosyltransferase [Candidatus Synechococcus calcipolaris]MDG2991148.1 adenine phosphoribosyltransferase [Candidatus Synechococcus calcipolaris G9]